ncbi:citrate/2-methylcitrate synthase [Bacillus xiapuensis]|uniref:citrate/2-methylcitrate synthase n=1 Tax=Bacillus xiapuensis TaxID=2014075 RepID=UPI002E2326AA
MLITSGLQGIVATQSAVSSINDGELTYRGIKIEKSGQNANFEEVIYVTQKKEI